MGNKLAEVVSRGYSDKTEVGEHHPLQDVTRPELCYRDLVERRYVRAIIDIGKYPDSVALKVLLSVAEILLSYRKALSNCLEGMDYATVEFVANAVALNVVKSLLPKDWEYVEFCAVTSSVNELAERVSVLLEALVVTMIEERAKSVVAETLKKMLNKEDVWERLMILRNVSMMYLKEVIEE